MIWAVVRALSGSARRAAWALAVGGWRAPPPLPSSSPARGAGAVWSVVKSNFSLLVPTRVKSKAYRRLRVTVTPVVGGVGCSDLLTLRRCTLASVCVIPDRWLPRPWSEAWPHPSAHGAHVSSAVTKMYDPRPWTSSAAVADRARRTRGEGAA